MSNRAGVIHPSSSIDVKARDSFMHRRKISDDGMNLRKEDNRVFDLKKQ